MGADRFSASETSHPDTIHEIMPVLEVDHPFLRFFKYFELLYPSLIAELFSFQVLPSQQGINIFVPCPLESESYADPQQLIGIGLNKMIER